MINDMNHDPAADLSHGVVLEVDPAVGHEGAGGQAEQHAHQLPGEGVGQPEHGEEDEVARAEPHPLAVRARHPELLKLDGSTA